jgi:carbon-monoxide dehydrogenase large subunit
VSVDVTPDGFIEIFSATQAMGQGIQTSYAQLAVDVFGVPIEKVRIVQGDTDRGNGFGSAGSRSLFTGGSAVKVGAEMTVERAKGLAAEALEAAAGDIEYRAGRFSVVGTDLGIDLFALAGKQAEGRIHVDASATAGGPSWPNACHVCEVEIDPDSGEVQVVSYASVNDIGRVVSPTIVRGQVGRRRGPGHRPGALGAGRLRRRQQPARHRQLHGLRDAARRGTAGVPHRVRHLDPCLTNPLGAKGVGELGTIGATPATMNAVADALAHAGARRGVRR